MDPLKDAYRLISRSQFVVNMSTPTKAVKETEESTGISNLSRPLEISAQFLWVDANDGELGRPVKPLPSGLVGSNPTLPTTHSGITQLVE